MVKNLHLIPNSLQIQNSTVVMSGDLLGFLINPNGQLKPQNLAYHHHQADTED
jgi:hypothetical protein